MERLLNAYPLFIKDPYFSIYSNGDILTESDTIFWTGAKKELLGLVKIDNKIYSFLGKSEFEKLEQINVELETFKTIYTFKKDDFILKVEFVSPLTLNDLKLLSCPICYMHYDFVCSNKHDFEIYLLMNEKWCYNEGNNDKHQIIGNEFKFRKYNVAKFGLRRQLYLSQSNDEFLSDWGYFYLAGENAHFFGKKHLKTYLLNDDFMPKFDGEDKYISASNKSYQGNILIGHDDVVAIQYFDDFLKTYYFEDGKNIFDAIRYVYYNIPSIENKMKRMDDKIKKLADKVSPHYYLLCCASYRQSIGGHKLVQKRNGDLLFLSKECGSNGCIGTVDVSYPSLPLYLMFSPILVKGMMVPILDFASKPIWKYDFAPHDVGRYPLVVGQVYGNKEERIKYNSEKDFGVETYPVFANYPFKDDIYYKDKQMPVEESGDMLIMAYSYYKETKELDFIKKNYEIFNKWANYLSKKGLIPDNQLCTDDFAGHLDKNINLSIKACIALKAFAKLSKILNNQENELKYNKIVKSFTKYIESYSSKRGFLPLTYQENDNRFSLKYNFAMDKFLKFNLFSQEIINHEINLYLTKVNEFGIPLDERKDYSKTDWQLWVASFVSDELKNKIIDGIVNYMKNGVNRTPFPDWYETKTGLSYSMKNRTVQGGIFFPLLMNK